MRVKILEILEENKNRLPTVNCRKQFLLVFMATAFRNIALKHGAWHAIHFFFRSRHLIYAVAFRHYGNCRVKQFFS